MQDLTRYNSKNLAIGRFFDGLNVELILVYPLGDVDHFADKEVDLIIGKRRILPLCLQRMKTDSDVFIMVKDGKDIIAHDKLATVKEDGSQRERIDIESYLLDKGYQYAQHDSKKYARERAKKRVFVSIEMNKYGEFSAHHSWLDIDVFYAKADFCPGACRIGESNVISMILESFGDEYVDVLREMTKEKNQWDVKQFMKFLDKLFMSNDIVIKTDTATITAPSYESQWIITRKFAEGDYTFAISRNRYDAEKRKSELKVVSTVFYSIMHAASLSECKVIEAKTKLLYGNLHI